MNIVLWVLQVALAFMYISGGGFKVFKTEALAGHFRSFPAIAWRVLGVIELVGGVMVVVPTKVSGMPTLTWMTAALLAVETLALAVAYGRKSTKLVAANPFGWCVAMGVLAAVVAYGRYV